MVKNHKHSIAVFSAILLLFVIALNSFHALEHIDEVALAQEHAHDHSAHEGATVEQDFYTCSLCDFHFQQAASFELVHFSLLTPEISTYQNFIHDADPNSFVFRHFSLRAPPANA